MLNHQTRAEWQAEKDDIDRHHGTHGFDPGMPWRVAYWYERLGIVFFYAIGWGSRFAHYRPRHHLKHNYASVQ